MQLLGNQRKINTRPWRLVQPHPTFNTFSLSCVHLFTQTTDAASFGTQGDFIVLGYLVRGERGSARLGGDACVSCVASGQGTESQEHWQRRNGAYATTCAYSVQLAIDSGSTITCITRADAVNANDAIPPSDDGATPAPERKNSRPGRGE